MCRTYASDFRPACPIIKVVLNPKPKTSYTAQKKIKENFLIRVKHQVN